MSTCVCVFLRFKQNWPVFEIVVRMPHQKLPGTNLYESGPILSLGLKRSREK